MVKNAEGMMFNFAESGHPVFREEQRKRSENHSLQR